MALRCGLAVAVMTALALVPVLAGDFLHQCRNPITYSRLVPAVALARLRKDGTVSGQAVLVANCSVGNPGTGAGLPG